MRPDGPLDARPFQIRDRENTSFTRVRSRREFDTRHEPRVFVKKGVFAAAEWHGSKFGTCPDGSDSDIRVKLLE
jgi:hypothetical protein